MSIRLVEEENTIYEIDLDCIEQKKQREAKRRGRLRGQENRKKPCGVLVWLLLLYRCM